MMYNNYFGHGMMRGINGFDDGSWFMTPSLFLGLSILGFLLALIFVISIVLKGYSLWLAAKRNEKWWFIALLVINTMGILEIIYLLFVAKVSFRKGCKCLCEKCGKDCKCGHNHCKVEGADKAE